MAERFKASVLKTDVGATLPRVRIPPLPQLFRRNDQAADYLPADGNQEKVMAHIKYGKEGLELDITPVSRWYDDGSEEPCVEYEIGLY